MTSNRVPRRKPSSKRAPRPRGGERGNAVSRFFDHFAARVTKWTGSPVAFGTALLAVLVWGLSGPAFGYSETWQLVINTGTTIVTFLLSVAYIVGAIIVRANLKLAREKRVSQ